MNITEENHKLEEPSPNNQQPKHSTQIYSMSNFKQINILKMTTTTY